MKKQLEPRGEAKVQGTRRVDFSLQILTEEAELISLLRGFDPNLRFVRALGSLIRSSFGSRRMDIPPLAPGVYSIYVHARMRGLQAVSSYRLSSAENVCGEEALKAKRG